MVAKIQSARKKNAEKKISTPKIVPESFLSSAIVGQSVFWISSFTSLKYVVTLLNRAPPFNDSFIIITYLSCFFMQCMFATILTIFFDF